MPDPWGGDNMSEAYAPHLYPHLKETLVKTESTKIPVGWDKDDYNELVPRQFKDFLRLQQSPVLTRPTFTNALPTLVTQFENVVHKAFNDACRIAGIEVEGRDSEVTWEYAVKVGDKLSKYISESWKDQDDRNDYEKRKKAEELSHKMTEYRAAKARAEALAKELNLKPEEI